MPSKHCFCKSPQATRISIRDNEVTAGLAAPLQSRAIAIRADGSSAVQGAEIRNNTVSTLGRTVLRFTAPVVNGRIRQELDVRGLAAGVYFYELRMYDGLRIGSGKLARM